MHNSESAMRVAAHGCAARPVAPEPDRLFKLDQQFRAGRAAAWHEIAAAAFPWLLWKLTARFRRVSDEACCQDAVTRALEQYRSRPERFQPGRGWTLSAFLVNLAASNLCHALRPCRHRPQPLPPPHEKDFDKICRIADRRGYLVVESREDLESRLTRISAVLSREEQMCALMLSSRSFAAESRLAHLPPEQRRRAAKRLRDRVLKKVRALAAKRVDFALHNPSPVLLKAPRSSWANVDSHRLGSASPHWRTIGDPASGLCLRAGHDALKVLGPETVFDIAVDVDRRCRELPEMFDPVPTYRYDAGGCTAIGAVLVVFDDGDTAVRGYPSRHGLVLVSTWKEWHKHLAADAREDARKRRRLRQDAAT
jgi:hypothetical protein